MSRRTARARRIRALERAQPVAEALALEAGNVVPFLARGGRRIVEGEVAKNDPSWLGVWSTVAYNPSELVGKQGLRIFDQMRRDDQVKAAISFKRDALLAPGWEVVSPEGQAEDWQVTEFIRRRLEAIKGTLNRTLRECLSAMAYGYSIAEKVYERVELGEDAGLVGIRSVNPLRPHDYEFGLDQFGRIRDEDGIIATFDGSKYPREKFIVYSYQAEWGNPYGESDLEAAYRSWGVLHNSYKWMAALLEKHGIPPVVVLYDPHKFTAAQSSALEGILGSFRNGSSIKIPRADKDAIELWTPQLAGQVSQVFIPAQQHLKQDIARALLMPGYLGVTPDAAGSYARAKVTLEMFLLHVSYVQSCLAEEVVMDQLIKPLVDLNFETKGIYPLFRFKPMQDEVKDQIATKWAELVGAGVVVHKPEDENFVRGTLGAPVREIEEDEQELPHLPLEKLDKLGRALKIGEVRKALRLEPSDRDDEWMRALQPDPVPGQGLPGQPGGPPPDDDLPGVGSDPIRERGERTGDADTEDDDDEEDDDRERQNAEYAKAFLDLSEEQERELAEAAASDLPDPGPPSPDDPSLSEAERRVEFAQIASRLDDLDRDAVRMVALAARKAIQARLAELGRQPPTLRTIGRVRIELPESVTSAYVKAMLSLYRQGSADCRTEVTQTVEFDVQGAPVFSPTAAIEWLKAKAEFFISGLAQRFTEIARGELLEGLRQGRPFRETSTRILELLQPWVGSQGLDPQALRADRMLTVVRTQSTAAYNQGRIVEARRLGKLGLVKGMQFSSVLDNRTTPTCRHLSGKQFKIDDPALDTCTPPLHYRCRSILLSITLDMELNPISSSDLGTAIELMPQQFGGRAE